MRGTRFEENGFSAMEMFLVVLIVIILVAGANMISLSAARANEPGNLISDADQNFRAAISLAVRDLTKAGMGIPAGGIPIPNGTGALPIRRPGPPGSSLTFPRGLTVLPAVIPGASLGPVVLGQATDMVTVLYADNSLSLNQAPLQSISSDGSCMTVNSGTSISGNNGILPGDLILFSNTLGYAVKQVTGTDGAQTVFMASGDSLNLNQRNAPQGTLLQLRSNGIFPPTTATRLWMVSYYLDAFTEPLKPHLIRQVNNRSSSALAFGIDNMRITYDLADGVGKATDIAGPVTLEQIRGANLIISVRSGNALSRTQAFVRSNLKTQVSFRNLAFAERYR